MTRNHISLIGSFLCCHYFEKAYLPLLTLVYIFALLRYHVDNEMNQGRPPPEKKARKIPCLFALGMLIL